MGKCLGMFCYFFSRGFSIAWSNIWVERYLWWSSSWATFQLISQSLSFNILEASDHLSGRCSGQPFFSYSCYCTTLLLGHRSPYYQLYFYWIENPHAGKHSHFMQKLSKVLYSYSLENWLTSPLTGEKPEPKQTLFHMELGLLESQIFLL